MSREGWKAKPLVTYPLTGCMFEVGGDVSIHDVAARVIWMAVRNGLPRRHLFKKDVHFPTTASWHMLRRSHIAHCQFRFIPMDPDHFWVRFREMWKRDVWIACHWCTEQRKIFVGHQNTRWELKQSWRIMFPTYTDLVRYTCEKMIGTPWRQIGDESHCSPWRELCPDSTGRPRTRNSPFEGRNV